VRILDKTPEVAMVRRVFSLLCVAVLFTCVGCRTRTQLDKIWTFGEFREHAEQVDSEFDQLHKDIKDNFFGLDKPQAPPAAWTYRE
jgi:hypothetical protein